MRTTSPLQSSKKALKNEKGTSDGSKTYSYPGSNRDYVKQAFVLAGVIGSFLFITVLMVLMFDRILLGGPHLGMWHFLMLGILFFGSTTILLLMARSLSHFRIMSNEKSMAVYRGRSVVYIPYENMKAIDRIRIPGWWPLRADLKPRGKTARTMIRIRLYEGPPVTFVSGLNGEEQLIERIAGSARLGKIE